MPPTPHRLRCLGSLDWSKWLTIEGSSNSCHTGSHYTPWSSNTRPYIRQDKHQFYYTVCKCIINIRESNEWLTEGPYKVTRRGVEWEPFKIPQGNSDYIPKSTRHPFLLTRPRSHRYKKAIDPRNWVRNHSGNTNRCWQEHVQDWWQKLDRRTVYILTGISLNTWWARSENQRGRAIWIMNHRVF
jgi:hypothetical protein